MTHIDTLEFLQGGIRVSDGCWHEKFLGDEVILMQSTGLKDKNGVEIFEGDVVKVSVHNGFDYLDDEVCSVQQSRFHSGLVCINPNNDMECRIFNQDVLEDYQYEVIGNIYDDKELLEVEG
nr:YopX family protein [Enterococcus avium]